MSIEIACPPTEQHQTRSLRVIRFRLRKYFDQPSKLKSANVTTYIPFGFWKKTHVLQHLEVVQFAAADEPCIIIFFGYLKYTFCKIIDVTRIF